MPRAPDLAGRALDDRYELHAVIGEGAFGRVYEGHDRRLDRAVAVKVIKPWWAEDGAWVQRFQREAQLLARVNDPGIVQVFDFGHAEEGPYYVAELVAGESLAERLERGPLPPPQARAIAEQLARALGSAHAQGVVHCDVKPANVLLAPGGMVKIGDFGVARLAEATSQGPSATVAGTPRYMSPEQARGRPTTAATDVYSAGIVLYEMLAGEPPFATGSPVELGLRHLQDQPDPLPTRVPRALRDVVERALAKEPGERYRDGTEMAAALRAAATPEESHEGPSNTRIPRRATPATIVLGDEETIDLTSAKALAAAPTSVLSKQRPPGPPPSPPPRRVHGRPRGGRIALLASVLALAIAVPAVLLLGGAAARTTVPELSGLPRGGVEARAHRTHVRPAFSARHSEAAAAGVAISQDPAPGTRIAEGSTVRVVLSSGPPPVTVPYMLGQRSAAAESELAQVGLHYAVTPVAVPGSLPGVVTRQSPKPAVEVPRGATVALDVTETPRWRALTSLSGVDDGRSVPFRILGSRWRVSYSMSYRGTCLLLVT